MAMPATADVPPVAVKVPEDSPSATTELDERPRPLEEAVPRTPRQQDRLESLSLFAAGRMHAQKQEFETALRLYQRALRYEPAALPIVREIIPLAFSLGHNDEAVRYALIVVELDPSDPALMRRLAAHLTSEGKFDRALSLYEKIRDADANRPKDSSYVLLVAQMGKLYFVNNQPAKAAESYAEVMKALANPDEYGLSKQEREAVISDAARTYNLIHEPAEGEKRSEEALAHELFGQAFLAAEMAELAQAAFDKVQELAADEAIQALHRASVLAINKDQAKAALEQLDTYFKSEPSEVSAEAYDLLEKVLKQLDREDHLVSRLEKLAEVHTEDRALLHLLASRYQAHDQGDQAQSLYEKLNQEQTSLQASRELITIYQQKQDAAALFGVLRDTIPKLGSADLLGEPLENLLKDAPLLEQVLAAAREARGEGSEEQQFESQVAAALLALEGPRPVDAGEFFEAVIRLRPDNAQRVYLQWGLGLMMKEEAEASVEVLRKAIAEDDPDEQDPETLFHLSGALAMAKQNDEALEIAKRAVQRAEDQRDTLGDRYYRFLGRVPWIHYHAGQNDQAAAVYEALIEQFDDKHDSSAIRAAVREARMILSNICVMQDNLAQAEEWLEQVLDEYPEDISAKNDLGYLWADQNKHLHRAVTMIEQAVEGDPENAAYRDSLGWAYYRLARYEEALTELHKAIELDENPDAVILDHLADTLIRLDRDEEARAKWLQALEVLKEAEGQEDLSRKIQDKIDATSER
jgi:tetratricopeptide (TPR) repeat protein